MVFIDLRRARAETDRTHASALRNTSDGMDEAAPVDLRHTASGAAMAGMASGSRAFISIADVSKTYVSQRGDVEALSAINLEIRAGQFVSVLGPSGCGKSTLLRCVAGLSPISKGEIKVTDTVVHGPIANVGIVFQRDVLLDWRSVLGNVLLTAEFRKSRRDMRPRALELLAKFGLQGFEGRFPWELSGGMRQRVAICRALLDDPPILLMDEPFGALDALTRDELNVELQRIWHETGKTVLFITHSIPEAIFLSDRVVVMSPKPGRIVETLDIDLPRRRRLSVRETPAFGDYAARLRRVFAGFGILREE